jgi:hypothetical protein
VSGLQDHGIDPAAAREIAALEEKLVKATATLATDAHK